MSDDAKDGAHNEALPRPKEPDDRQWAGHVLVVDDEDSVRNLVVHSLTRLGFDTRMARDGTQAVAAFEADPELFRLAILDLKLPGFDGIEVMRRIRAIRPDTPVILMSGYYRIEPAAPAEPSAPTGFLHKPFTLAALTSEIRSVLSG